MSKPFGSIACLVSGLLIAACGSGGAFTASGAGGDAAGGESSLSGSGGKGASAAGGSSDGGESSGVAGGMSESGSAGDTTEVGGAGGALAGAGGPSGGVTGLGGAATGGGAGGVVGGDALCPVATGYYQTIKIEGGGCGDLATTTPVCISAGIQVCRYQLKSGDPKSVNGAVLLQPGGAFEGAVITEGTAMRSGCKGQFSGNTLSIACGGPDASSSQYCGAALTRTAAKCP
jgi:hypothetical protein